MSKGKLEVRITRPQRSSPEFLARASAFVRSHHPATWAPHRLDLSYLLEVEAAGDLVTLLWALWIPGSDRTLDLHCCARPDYRSRWMTRPVIQGLFQLPVLARARGVIAQVPTPHIERIYRRLGFDMAAGLAVLNTEHLWKEM